MTVKFYVMYRKTLRLEVLCFLKDVYFGIKLIDAAFKKVIYFIGLTLNLKTFFYAGKQFR